MVSASATTARYPCSKSVSAEIEPAKRLLIACKMQAGYGVCRESACISEIPGGWLAVHSYLRTSTANRTTCVKCGLQFACKMKRNKRCQLSAIRMLAPLSLPASCWLNACCYPRSLSRAWCFLPKEARTARVTASSFVSRFPASASAKISASISAMTSSGRR